MSPTVLFDISLSDLSSEKWAELNASETWDDKRDSQQQKKDECRDLHITSVKMIKSVFEWICDKIQ
jgi:hypothetical protein